jgi:hypothetical protein
MILKICRGFKLLEPHCISNSGSSALQIITILQEILEPNISILYMYGTTEVLPFSLEILSHIALMNTKRKEKRYNG